jgi:hypothetical protein
MPGFAPASNCRVTASWRTMEKASQSAQQFNIPMPSFGRGLVSLP